VRQQQGQSKKSFSGCKAVWGFLHGDRSFSLSTTDAWEVFAENFFQFIMFRAHCVLPEAAGMGIAFSAA
jgi:hypothetical protein